MLDATLALVSFAGTIAVATHGTGAAAKHGTDAAGGDGAAVAVTLAAVASWPLVAWRRAPLAVFVVTLLGSAALMALGYPGAPPIGATIALYLVALSRDDDHPWTRTLAVIVTVLFAVHFAAFALGHSGSTPLLQIAIGALTWALARFAGERGRLRRKELAELHQRALRAERDAERERRLELTVDNPAAADADAARAARVNGGHGLVGMRERAALVGGDLRAGRNNGHFRVQAVLRYGASA